jgi:ABC-type Fe3+ transport system permease subunit
VEILAQLRSLSFGTAAAYSVLLILLVLAVTVLARVLEGRAEYHGPDELRRGTLS